MTVAFGRREARAVASSVANLLSRANKLAEALCLLLPKLRVGRDQSDRGSGKKAGPDGTSGRRPTFQQGIPSPWR
jgi:hypothetical protein